MIAKMSRFLRSTNPSRLMSKGDVARFFAVSNSIIERWVADGKLPKPITKFGMKRWEYDKIAPLRKGKSGVSSR